MKTIVLNASPRKNMNTAQLLKEAARGAESVGAEVEYHDLYDMSFTGCRSCMACKRLDAQPQHCYWKDDLSTLIDVIYQADALIVGSPIYLMDTLAQFHALLERLAFVNMSYGRPVPFHGRVNVGGIFTMNADPQWYHGRIEEKLKEQLSWLRGMNGKIMLLPSLDTL